MTVAEATVERPVRRNSKGLPQWNVQPIDRVEGSTFSHFQAPTPRGPNEQSTPTSTPACEMQSEQSIGNGHQYSSAPGVGPSLHAQRPRPGSTRKPISTTGRMRLVHNRTGPTEQDHSSHGVPTQESSIRSRRLSELSWRYFVGPRVVKLKPVDHSVVRH